MLALESRIHSRRSRRASTEAPASRRRARFRREGDYWTVAYEGTTVRVRDAKGMHYLARLLADPGREFHALDLAGDGGSPVRRWVSADESGMAVGDVGDAGIRLDAEAKSAYRARLHELQEEAAEAEAWNDSERAARAQQEIAFLTEELKGAVGLGGRDRRGGVIGGAGSPERHACPAKRNRPHRASSTPALGATLRRHESGPARSAPTSPIRGCRPPGSYEVRGLPATM